MLAARITLLGLALSGFAAVAVARDPAPVVAGLPAASATVDLDRYVGDYAFTPGKVLHVYRAGTDLRAKPPGQPEATLAHEEKPGNFSVQGTPMTLEFVGDPLGGVTGVYMVAPNGQRQHLRRLRDAAAAAPLREIAGNRDTSVNAQVFNGYKRTKSADGKFKPESYVFGNGGFQDDAAMTDKSIDDLSFVDLARSLAPSLARQNYYPPAEAQKLETIDLIVMVYWGSTAGKHDPLLIGMPNAVRDQVSRRNARVLGYKDAVSGLLGVDWVGSIRTRAHDLIDEVEERRYWVALVALDFAAARKEKKIKLLWSIRYNMASQGSDFTTALPQMTNFASKYFGRDTHGLWSPSLTPPEGEVKLGELKILPDEATK